MSETQSSPILIIGLGNPGRQYNDTRHNIGFQTADRLAARFGVSFNRLQMQALTCDARPEGRRVILAKPQTYMNLSGVAVGALARFYKIPLENLLVAHDDVDLPFATLRLRPGGSSGGQKGVESIIERMGTQEFARLRIGIGRPPGAMLAAAYVLQPFTRDETQTLPAVLDRAADAAWSFICDGLDAAMNRYNGPLDK